MRISKQKLKQMIKEEIFKDLLWIDKGPSEMGGEFWDYSWEEMLQETHDSLFSLYERGRQHYPEQSRSAFEALDELKRKMSIYHKI